MVTEAMPDPLPTAPRMPSGYGAPIDASGADVLPWSRAVEQLENARNYWLCTTGRDGRPHAALLWALWFDGVLWFSTDPTSQKGRNLARDPRSSFHLEHGDDVVILEGEATRTEWSKAIVDAYEAKYGYRIDTENENYALYVLHPRVANTWTEKAYPGSATRWVFT